jgi:hypothetical protein
MRRTFTALLAVPALLVLGACGNEIDAAEPEAAASEQQPTEKEPEKERAIIPDVSGMGAEEATAALEDAGFTVQNIGEGTEVIRQQPSAGMSVSVGSNVMITLTTPEPEGTRRDPFPAGTVLAGSQQGLTVAEVTLGAAIWAADDVIRAENQFNDPAPEGSTYVILPVTVTNVGTDDPVTPWLDLDVAYVAPDGRSFEKASVVVPNNLNDVADLYEGGTGTGNIAFTIPVDQQGGVWAVSWGFSDPVFVSAS